MPTTQELLQGLFTEALKAAFPDSKEAEITPSTQAKFGHYQCNSALKVGGNPREAAQRILEAVKPDGIIEKMEIAGPGFINITLTPDFLSRGITHLLSNPHLGVDAPKHPKKVLVEFSSPNIAKELHVGHLRSTIIGDSIARLMEFLGHDVLRLNHVGDWGTQFGMLIAYLKEFQPDFFTGKKKADLPELMHWYKESKKQFDADPDFKKRSQLEVVKLQGGDEASLEAWEKICDVSREAFHNIYALLDISLQERGESFYNPYLSQVVSDLEKKNLIQLSDGAKCVFLEGYTTREGTPLPIIVQKSDGGYNYDTTDIAAMRHRIEKEEAERIIVVTDAGQSLHFEMLEKLCEKAGYLKAEKIQFDHVPFGVVLGPDGKKFKTRSGETEKLIDLVTQAITRAQAIFRERLPEASEQEIQELGQTLGIDALKYADLSGHRVKDYTFSYDRMLRFEGNTAAFLLYSYVRIKGIKRKVGIDPATLIGKEPITLSEPSEIALALQLLRFSETLHLFERELLPSRLCEYLYNLAETFNAFFRDCRVEGSPQEKSRLLLCEATTRVLETGLSILGLKTLPRM